jgi:xanthine/uracil permease
MTALSGTLFEIIQYSSFVIAILVLIFALKTALIRKQILWAIPVLLLMAHGILYYVLLFYFKLNGYSTSDFFFTKWSTVLRFQTYATFLIMEISRYILAVRSNKHG